MAYERKRGWPRKRWSNEVEEYMRKTRLRGWSGRLKIEINGKMS